MYAFGSNRRIAGEEGDSQCRHIETRRLNPAPGFSAVMAGAGGAAWSSQSTQPATPPRHPHRGNTLDGRFPRGTFLRGYP